MASYSCDVHMHRVGNSVFNEDACSVSVLDLKLCLLASFASSAFFFVRLMWSVVFFSAPLSCLPVLSHVPFCAPSSRRVAFQERRVRMRVPISSVVPPQAAVAPPLAEPRCDWPHSDSLAHLPVKRLTVHAAKWRPHCAPKH